MIKLGEAVEVFLSNYEDRRKTYWSYHSILNRMSVSLGADRYVDAVTPMDMERYLADLKNNNLRYIGHPHRPNRKHRLSQATVRKHKKAIKYFWAWLVKKREVEHSPCGDWVIGSQKAALDHKMVPTMEEIRMILQGFYGNRRNYALFRFLVDTGCRAGEAVSLEIDKLDIDRGIAEVCGKFGKSYRVFFSRETAISLAFWLLERKPVEGNNYVFPMTRRRKEREEDEPESSYSFNEPHLHPDSVSRMLYQMCKKLGIRRISAHMIRYFKGTQLAKAGVHPSVAARILGHEPDNLETVAKFYTQIDDEWVREASAKTHVSLLDERHIDPIQIKQKKIT